MLQSAREAVGYAASRKREDLDSDRQFGTFPWAMPGNNRRSGHESFATDSPAVSADSVDGYDRYAKSAYPRIL